jgi:hypothetical protein
MAMRDRLARLEKQRPDTPPMVFLIGDADGPTPDRWAEVLWANRTERLRGMVFTWEGSVDATLADARERKAARARG